VKTLAEMVYSRIIAIMHPFVRGGTIMLLLGDMAVLYGSLACTLLIRYQEISSDMFSLHVTPFTILFVIWIGIFFIAGLYDRHVSLVRKSIPSLVIKAQVVNILVAALFFFVFDFGIEPKTNLAIYLVTSTILMIAWRLYVYPRITAGKPSRVLVIGDSEEALAIARVFAANPYFKNIKPFMLSARDIPDFNEFRDSLFRFVRQDSADMVIADMRDAFSMRLVNDFYTLAFEYKNIRFFNLPTMYEQLHHRIPSSLIEETWLLENITTHSPHYAYDVLKRGIDIFGALTLLIPALFIFPFVMLAQYLEDKGPFFYRAERVGKHNKPIYILKFRTMTGVDNPKDALQSTLRITRVGAFLRKTRIDELPQLFNVLAGDVSFIGPRPEIPTLAHVYAEQIPYYNMRHLTTPGLSGWAQINNFDVPRGGVDVPRTRDKLSFDLYYLKHRSLLLDIEIALKTINTLLMRTGT
jgi:lipopolysaccharide/colanic/teichoic acid biosynthesis glycosyltransferase